MEVPPMPGSTLNPTDVTPLPIAHPDILDRVISFLPSTQLPKIMRISRVLYDIAGRQLYRQLPGPFGPRLRRLQTTLARDRPARVFALMRHTSVVHFTDGLRLTLLYAMLAGNLVMPNITHVIIDGLAVRTPDVPGDNNRLLSASSDITVVCNTVDMRGAVVGRCWQPYMSPSVRWMIVLFNPGSSRPATGGFPYTASIPPSVERLTIVLRPLPGRSTWVLDNGEGIPMRTLVDQLAFACLARAGRIIIAGADRVDPLHWWMADIKDEPKTGAEKMQWLEARVKERVIWWKKRREEQAIHYPTWAGDWTDERVEKHLERVEFISARRYAREFR